MDDPLGNPLVVEVRDLFAHDEIFEQRRAARTGRKRVLVVGDLDALVGAQRLAVRAQAKLFEIFGLRIGARGGGCGLPVTRFYLPWEDSLRSAPPSKTSVWREPGVQQGAFPMRYGEGEQERISCTLLALLRLRGTACGQKKSRGRADVTPFRCRQCLHWRSPLPDSWRRPPMSLQVPGMLPSARCIDRSGSPSGHAPAA